MSAIQNYYQELQRIDLYGGNSKETAIRSAFHTLLNNYCQTKGFQLVDELEYKNTKNYPDGTIKDSLRQDWGYWEAKDTDDNLDKEIAKKFAKGYPQDNIIFEDSQTAVLIQNGQEVSRIDMKNPEDLNKILKRLLDYKKLDILDFEKAIAEFSSNVPNIVESLREMIVEQTTNNNQVFLKNQNEFLEICREAINPQISTEDIKEMLIQHILTEDIFLSVFDESQFHRENNIAKQLFELEQTFLVGQTKRELLNSISHYYKIIKARASQISDHHEKQKFLKVIYENFYKHYNPDKADTLGVVYTPNEIVKFIISGCNYLSSIHFGKTLGDKNVKILDPATGTGTFITELIDFLPNDTLEYKYQHELFCNEIAILPYYVANLNIEFTYQQKTKKYLEFTNISLVDTLDNVFFGGKYKDSLSDDIFGSVSLENSLRIQRQNDQEISIVLGNPPYNANQMNFNDNNANRTYPAVDSRIKETYIKESKAQKTKVYDMYSRFFRWASDRIVDNGIVAFVTNSSFIDSKTFDGFRKSVMTEFDYIYVLDCGGNVRAGETDGNVFDIMTGVAVCFLVKNKPQEDLPDWSKDNKLACELYYTKLTATGKTPKLLEIGLHSTDFARVPFKKIVPDKNNNWLNQSTTDWHELIPIASKQQNKEVIFDFYSNGVATNRDYWVYDLNKQNLIKKVKFFISEYNQSLEMSKKRNSPLEEYPTIVGGGVLSDKIKWSRDLLSKLKRGMKLTFNETKIVRSQYRPFVEKWFYAEKIMNDVLTQNHYDMFGEGLESVNECIVYKIGKAGESYFFATGTVQDLMTNGGNVLFPRYRYQKNQNGEIEKIDNISDWALEEFRNRYEKIPLVRGGTEGDGVFSNSLSNNTNYNEQITKTPPPTALGTPQKENPGTEVKEIPLVRGGTEGDGVLSTKAKFIKYSQLPYNPKLKEKAKQLRKAGNLSEVLFWNKVKNKQLLDLDFERQKIIGNYIVDFYCAELCLIVEIDGESHDFKGYHDQERENYLKSLDLATIHFEDIRIKKDLDNVMSELYDFVVNLKNTPSANAATSQEGNFSVSQQQINKDHIFAYVYGVLHHTDYRLKYQTELKRDFPRIPFYPDFWQFASTGQKLLDVHLNYQNHNQSLLEISNSAQLFEDKNLQPILKLDKINGEIILDKNTKLKGLDLKSLEYKLGTRSAIEWVLEQYKESCDVKNTELESYNWLKIKPNLIQLLQQVYFVSLETIKLLELN